MKTEKDCKKIVWIGYVPLLILGLMLQFVLKKSRVLRVNEGKWGPSIQVMKGLDSALEKESFDTNALCTSKAQSLK